MGVYNQMTDLGVNQDRNNFVPNPIVFPKKLNPVKVKEIIHDLGVDVKFPYLLFVGQLLERKSILEVIDAFDVFTKDHPNFRLVLVGRNMLGDLIQEKLSKNNNILHIGPVEREKVVALMQNAEMILQPSRVEGIPRVSLEALSLGKKVLLPPCVPEFVPNNELFSIDKVKTSEIAEAINRIHKTDKLPQYDLSVHDPKESKKFLKSVYETTTNN